MNYPTLFIGVSQRAGLQLDIRVVCLDFNLGLN